MTPERWAEIDRVWHAVLARPETEHTVALIELCGSDLELRAEVESLLANLGHARAAGFGATLGLATDSRSLVGRQLGQYAVRALIGVGGMGEVYQAHDSTLGRDVALKILPDLWHGDQDRRARFDREARVLASLNHPNVGAIYGVQDSDGVKALVLELVEGETLGDRIIRQPPPHRGLPFDEVTTIAAQIIDALEAAHERGIVHRDLKPGNIKITPDGRVKVLDFGLARAVSGGSSPALAHSPTITAATAGGVLLGTAAYMSPDQARGRTVDKRTDIWAFGCVLYEMLTGTSAFGGDGVTDVLANVIKGDPDWSTLPRDTPPALRLCVQRCLQKDLRQRFHDIADVRIALEGAFDIQSGVPGSQQRSRSSYARLAYTGWAVAAFVAITAGAVLVPFVNRTPSPGPETRLQIVTPPTSDPASIAISPDGRRVAFSGGRGRPIWLRRLESDGATPLMGTVSGTMPFWSPDNRSIGFFADGVLKRIDLDSNFVRMLAAAPQPRRGAWNTDGTIVFGAGSIGPLYRVPADGGNVQPATRLLPGQTNHRLPQFLPDGQRFLLFSLGSSDVRGVYLGSLADTSVRRVSDRESAYAFMPRSHLLFARQGALWARRLSADYTSTEGDLVPVAPKVIVYMTATGFGAFSASSTGSLAYRPSAGETQLMWLDRTGRTVVALGQPDDNQLGLVQMSSDGRTAALERMVEGNADLWLADTERGLLRRLTTDPGFDGDAIFSPDGSRVLYVTDGKADVFQMYERRSDGVGEPTLVFESGENKNPHDWSPDGRYVLYSSQRVETNLDLMALPLFGERKPFDVARTQFGETDGRFSPNGRWVAYTSTETGQSEILIQPFPGPGPKSQISVGGGTRARWRRDGQELFYVAPDNRLMSVPITQSGTSVQGGPPRALFTLATALDYEVAPDGQRFLTTAVVSEASPITVILNWKPPAR
jgi:eukaryotic-like serine/threonine-protein kinase